MISQCKIIAPTGNCLKWELADTIYKGIKTPGNSANPMWGLKINMCKLIKDTKGERKIHKKKKSSSDKELNNFNRCKT